MPLTLLLCVSLAASALAYQVIFPGKGDKWSGSGYQTLQWNKVSTDQRIFSVFLTNTDRQELPENNVLLEAIVDGLLNELLLSPPNGVWPSGKTFRVNLCKDENSPESILAQSPEFEIVGNSNGEFVSPSTLPKPLGLSTSSMPTDLGASTFHITDSPTSTSSTADSASQPTTRSLNAAVVVNPQIVAVLVMAVTTLGALLV
uniref:Uncharacterized protein n=1 Tax=Moniliophthora roreri TaxID=221103 RepID=A0A0W0EZ89_MONRR